MTKEELEKEAEEYALANRSMCVEGDNADLLKEVFLDVAEPREKRIAELEQQLSAMEKGTCDVCKVKDAEFYEKRIADLEAQIEKMKCCENCRFDYCETSSEYIDNNGNRTFHCWNEEKEKYCDVGKNGKYQCWEIKEK